MVNFFVKGVGSTNKGKSTSRIIQNMNNGNCESPYVFNKIDSNKDIETSRTIKLKKQQKLVPRVINPQTNLKGLLVFHGLGSGKTGTSIIVGEACKHIMTTGNNISTGSNRSKGRVLVVVPASLKEQYKNEILGSLSRKKSDVTQKDLEKGLMDYMKNNDDINFNNFNEEKFNECVINKRENPKKYPKINNSFSSNIRIDDVKQSYYNPKHFKSENKVTEQKVAPQRLKRVNQTYTVISRQSFMKDFLYKNEKFMDGEVKTFTKDGRWVRNYLKEPNGLLIIDEIQNLISETGSWYKKLLKGINYYCHPTTRILLLTATPIYDKTFELGLTINLLNPRIRFPETRIDFDKLFVATSQKDLEEEENRKITKPKDIEERKLLFMSKKDRIIKFQKAQSGIEDNSAIDYTEITAIYDKTQKNYIKLDKIFNKIPKHLIQIPITQEISKCLEVLSPKILDKFNDKTSIDRMTLFKLIESYKKILFLNEYKNSTIKNKDMFEYMCSGYISYFKGGNPRGFPKKITKIIDCKMKGAQSRSYIGIVKMEIKKNRDSEASRKLNPNSTRQGTYFQKACMCSNVKLTYTRNDQISKQEIKNIKNSIIKQIREMTLKKGIGNSDILDKINNMNLLQLQELQELQDSDSIHDAIYEEESTEEKEKKAGKKLIKDIESITNNKNKKHLKTIIKMSSEKNKSYYEATLRVIRDEILSKKTDKEKLKYIDKDYSCKFAKMISKILKEENGDGKHFIYSRFKTRGVECLSYMLEGFGYKRYNEDEIAKLKKDVDKYPELQGKCFTVWSGDIMDKVEFSKNFKSIYNHSDNQNGKYLKIVLGTESIMEGVDLKEVKYVHITEPWWNESRMDQVMGRAIRWKSHINMDPVHRKVIIYRYYALCDLEPKDFSPDISPLIDNQKSIDIVEHALDGYDEDERRVLREDLEFAAHKLENKDPISPLAFSSIDRYIQIVAEKKKRLNQMFYKSIKNSAIDCLFNKYGNTYRLEEEIYYKHKKDEKDKETYSMYYYDPTEHKYYDTNFKEVNKDISRNDLYYTPKDTTNSREELKQRKISTANDIYRENIECNFSNKTGIEFLKILENKGMKHLLNDSQQDEIKKILFERVVYKNQEEQEEIKKKIKECLKNKELGKNIDRLFNTMIETSLKTKVINNITSVLEEYKFENWKKSNTTSTIHEEREKRSLIKNEVDKIKTLLYEQSIEYLKQSEMMLKIDTIGDKVYKDLIKGLQTKKSSSRPRQTNLARRGGIFRNNNQTPPPPTINNPPVGDNSNLYYMLREEEQVMRENPYGLNPQGD